MFAGDALYILRDKEFCVQRTYRFCVDAQCLSDLPRFSNLKPVTNALAGKGETQQDIERALCPINTPRGLHITRNYMKKIAIQENSATAWQQARNEVNNAIKSAKKQYFTHNLEVNKLNPRKTWKLIDDLTSRKNGRVRNISEIRVNNEPISSAVEMAEVFNDFFATIGSNLASEIQPSTIEPEFYLQPTDIFS